MNELKLGMVGCGEISHTHARAAAEISGIRFTACCDPDDRKSRLWGERYGCGKTYATLEEMLEQEALDGIVLATWPNLHRDQIGIALDRGIRHILCEKALCLTGEEALGIHRLARNYGATVLEACKNRYHPQFKRIRALARSGEFGRVDHIQATFSNNEEEKRKTDAPMNWRIRKECGGGVPYDWVSYLVNAANSIAPSLPVRAAASGTLDPVSGVMDRLYGIIEYRGGMVAGISSSHHASFSQELEIVCEKGRIYSPVNWGIFGDTVITLRRRQPDWPYLTEERLPVVHEDSFRNQMAHFAEVIRGRERPEIPLAESVVNALTIEALVHAAESGASREIRIPDFLNPYPSPESGA